MIGIYAFASVILISLISLIGIFALSLRKGFLKRSVFALVGLAVGALFGDVFIHIIPEIFGEFSNTATASMFVLAGILIFFSLEKFLLWRHSHDAHQNCDEITGECPDIKIKPVGMLIFFSDSVHNLIDGIIIGVSYLISIEVGIATTIAVILHEIPQEISDFGILIHAGYSRAKALLVNFISALFAILGTAIAFMLQGSIEQFIPIVLALGAGGFIYIAGSDLVPELHKTSNIKNSVIQFLMILVGIGLMFLVAVFEKYI